jgi:uncharacterized protein (DUF2062 family)
MNLNWNLKKAELSTPAIAPADGLWARWRRRVLELTLAQLRQGITPRKIALTIALGMALGLFPILGTTTVLCLLTGVLLQLNQPLIQAVSWLAWPLQIPGIYFFIRVGDWLTNAPHVPFSLTALLAAFNDSPVRFVQQFGLMGLRGVLAWALIAPPLAFLLYLFTLPALKRLVLVRAADSTE